MRIIKKILLSPLLLWTGLFTRIFEKRELIPKDFGDFSNVFEYGKESIFTLYKSVSTSSGGYPFVTTTTTRYGVMEQKIDGRGGVLHNFSYLKYISPSEFMTDFTRDNMSIFADSKKELILNKNIKFTISGKLIYFDISLDDVRDLKLNTILK